MVECECIPFTYGIWWLPVLIDTWWNVNELQSPTKQPEQLVLIDTWWNVNSGESHMPYLILPF